MKIDVKSYVDLHNKTNENRITRYHVYKMINEGKLKAHKGYKNKWIIELKEPETPTEYTVKEFVEAYNKKHRKSTKITIEEVRKMLADGILKGEKVNRKWVIYSSPTRKIK